MAGEDPARDTRALALERVYAASADRSRLRDELDAARGSTGELQADVSHRAASDEVAARERWLQWVEDGDY